MVARSPGRRKPGCSLPSGLRFLQRAVSALGLCFLAPAAHAFTFVLTGGGSDQHLNWHWEAGYPLESCQSNPTPCGDIASANGAFSSSYSYSQFMGRNMSTTSGGILSWTGDDSLKIVATNRVAASARSPIVFPQENYAESWAALNGRDAPMTFFMLAEPGDPPTTSLKITPQLLGSFTHSTTPQSYSSVFQQMLVQVAVNGIKVTADTSFTQWEYVNDADGTVSLGFPKGPWNTTVVPDVPANSQITVAFWSYERIYVSCPAIAAAQAQVTSTSPISPGPSIVVLAQPIGVVGVPDETAPPMLWLRALPNPSSGTTRIRYALSSVADTRLSVYDVTGHRVATLVDRKESAGQHETAWNGRDENGYRSPAGVYLMELSARNGRRVDKLVLLGP